MTDPTTIIGIDPGLDGGIVILRDGREPELHVMPTVETGKKKTRTLNLYGIRELFLSARKPVLVVMEDVQLRPGQKGARATIGNWHDIRGLLFGLEVPLRVVQAKEWQKSFGITGAKGDTKKQGGVVCQRLYPSCRIFGPKGGLIDGLSDALLIADYARKMNGANS